MTDSYEEYLNMQKGNKNPLYILAGKIKPVHIIGFIFLFFIANYIQKNNPESNWIYFVIGGLALLYLFSITREDQLKEIIPRDVAVEIAYHDLQNEIGKDKVFPTETKITPTICFKDQFLDSGEGPKIIKYNLGFKMKQPNSVEKEYIYQMNPHTGECKGIIETPMGFAGETIKDLQLIFPENIPEEKKKEN